MLPRGAVPPGARFDPISPLVDQDGISGAGMGGGMGGMGGGMGGMGGGMGGGMSGGSGGGMGGAGGGMGGGMGGMGGGMGGFGAPDNRPPEERFATQIGQLEMMGFIDREANLQALGASNGDVNDAITRLLERGMGN